MSYNVDDMIEQHSRYICLSPMSKGLCTILLRMQSILAVVEFSFSVVMVGNTFYGIHCVLNNVVDVILFTQLHRVV